MAVQSSCCLTLDDIGRHCGGNVAGLKTQICIECTEKIESIPEATDCVISDPIVFKTDDPATPEDETGKWYKWNVDKKNTPPTYTAEEIETGGWNVTVSFFVPYLCPTTTHILNNTQNGEYIMRICDKNGQPRLLGNLEDGVTISVNEQTNDVNGYVITATWETSHLPYFYTAAV